MSDVLAKRKAGLAGTGPLLQEPALAQKAQLLLEVLRHGFGDTRENC